MREKCFGKPIPNEEEMRVKVGWNERTIRLACTKCIYNDVLYRILPPTPRTLAAIVFLPLDFRPLRRRAAGIYSPLKSFTFYLSSGEARVVRGNFRGNCAVPAFLTPGEERCSRWWQCKKTCSKILLTGHAKEEQGERGVVNRAGWMHQWDWLQRYFTGKIKLKFIIVISVQHEFLSPPKFNCLARPLDTFYSVAVCV